MIDTDDLIQETVVNTLKHIDVFECRADAALQAYLRQAVMNRIRNEIRRAMRHPAPATLDSTAPDAGGCISRLSRCARTMNYPRADSFTR